MIKVISKGLYTTIQDKGRFGYRNIGVPSSGYMDSESAETANLIINNPKDNPLIEATLIGPTLEFKKSAVIYYRENLVPGIKISSIKYG